MTAENITPNRVDDLLAALQAATESMGSLYRDLMMGDINPAEAAAIVNETIENLTNEAR